LKAGTADIGIIPVAAYTTIPDLVVIPDVAIGAKDAVRSILLISKVPLDKIRSVATDNSSRTSAALTEVFLRKFVGVEPGFTPQQPDVQQMLRWHDACLLIGDPALQAATVGLYVYDLAEQWHRWTGYPFVFAFWTVRQAALQEYSGKAGLAEIFQQSRDHGLLHVDEIAADWAPRLGLEKSLVNEYLSHNIDYFLDSESLQGLRLFFRYQWHQTAPMSRRMGLSSDLARGKGRVAPFVPVDGLVCGGTQVGAGGVFQAIFGMVGQSRSQFEPAKNGQLRSFASLRMTPERKHRSSRQGRDAKNAEDRPRHKNY